MSVSNLQQHENKIYVELYHFKDLKQTLKYTLYAENNKYVGTFEYRMFCSYILSTEIAVNETLSWTFTRHIHLNCWKKKTQMPHIIIT